MLIKYQIKMNELPNEIFQHISEYTNDIMDLINIEIIAKNCDRNSIIYYKDLYNVDPKYTKNISQKMIEQPKYKYLKKIDLSNNNKIKNLNHLKNTLKVLICGGYKCKINQESISDLRLEELYAQNNKYIHNLDHMKETLKILDISEDCAIGQTGITQLNLVELYASNNMNIHNLNHMHESLKILNLNWNSEFTQEGISKLKLNELYIRGNKNIRDINHMKTLKILDCGKNSGIGRKNNVKLELDEIYNDDNITILNNDYSKYYRIRDLIFNLLYVFWPILLFLYVRIKEA